MKKLLRYAKKWGVLGEKRVSSQFTASYFTTANGLKFEFHFVNGSSVKQIWVTGRSINFGKRSNGLKFCTGHNWTYFK